MAKNMLFEAGFDTKIEQKPQKRDRKLLILVHIP